MLRGVTIAGVLLCLAPTARAWRGEVIRVYDGDYLSARYGRGEANIRLQGVRAPERGQPFSRQARALTRKLTAGKTLRVLPSTRRDRHARIIAWVFVGRTCINEELVRAGLARWDRETAPASKKLARLEREAQRARRGLWAAGAAQAGPAACKDPPALPCARDQSCKVGRDCTLVRKTACGCPPCSGREAWALSRTAARRWQQQRRRTRCPAVRCARCPRKLRAVCHDGQCVVRSRPVD